VFSFFTDNDSEICFVRRFIFDETDIFVETEGRIFDGKISDVRIQFTRLLYQLLRKIKKIVSLHMIEISIFIHPVKIIIFFDCIEESKSYFTNHTMTE